MYTPSHFTAVLLFALFASVVFGITQRSEPRAMVRYGIYCFSLFIARNHRGQLADVAHQSLDIRQPRNSASPTTWHRSDAAPCTPAAW